MDKSNELLAKEALGDEVDTVLNSPDPFGNFVETWTLDKEKNKRLVDALGYIPREKIIQKGIENGELLNAYRRSSVFMRQFDSSLDENIQSVPDVSSLDEMEIADLARKNQSAIDSKVMDIKSKQKSPEATKVNDSVQENKTE